MLWVEQKRERAFAVEGHFDPGDIADLILVGDGGYGPVLGLEDAKADRRIVRQDRAGPAAWAERADRREREHFRRERQNRAMRGEVVSGGPRRSRNQDTVTSEFSQGNAAVDRNLDLRSLPGLAE